MEEQIQLAEAQSQIYRKQHHSPDLEESSSSRASDPEALYSSQKQKTPKQKYGSGSGTLKGIRNMPSSIMEQDEVETPSNSMRRKDKRSNFARVVEETKASASPNHTIDHERRSQAYAQHSKQHANSPDNR